MDRFKENIDNQIEYNQGKNIFLDRLDFFQFAEETVKAISNIDKLNPDSKETLIDYATDKAIEEFCRINQCKLPQNLDSLKVIKGNYYV
ncbi:MAG TPA: hypothetical protein PK199_05195 [Bacteroidales bacterium]|nr:hypothetical protein [Bacteroidales bacterium]